MFVSTPEAAESYAKVSTNRQRVEYARLLSRCDIKPGLRCLDIGCGTGNNTVQLAEIVGDTGHVTAVDPDKERINVANSKYKRSNIDYIRCKSTQFPVPEEGYDVILSNCVMHWVKYEEKIETYQRVFRALKPGGIFASIENSDSIDAISKILQFCQDDVQVFVNNSFHFISGNENSKIFSDLGFENVQIETKTLIRSIPSLDAWLEFVTATYDGVIDASKVYKDHRDKIKFEVNEDGSLPIKFDLTYIFVRKPLDS